MERVFLILFSVIPIFLVLFGMYEFAGMTGVLAALITPLTVFSVILLSGSKKSTSESIAIAILWTGGICFLVLVFASEDHCGGSPVEYLHIGRLVACTGP